MEILWKGDANRFSALLQDNFCPRASRTALLRRRIQPAQPHKPPCPPFKHLIKEEQLAQPTMASPATVIWLHGLGDSGAGWSSLSQELGSQLKHVKWVFPNANDQPVTCNGGMSMPSWFDLTEIPVTPATPDVADSVSRAVKSVHSLIKKEVDKGVPADRIVLGGFSQGGAISLCAGLSYPEKLAGVVAFSGWLLQKGDYPGLISEPNKGAKVLCCHGTADGTVTFDCGREAAEILKGHGLDVDLKPFPGMAHSACPQEFQALAAYIKDVTA